MWKIAVGIVRTLVRCAGVGGLSQVGEAVPASRSLDSEVDRLAGLIDKLAVKANLSGPQFQRFVRRVLGCSGVGCACV